jgi:hypothetical protein
MYGVFSFDPSFGSKKNEKYKKIRVIIAVFDSGKVRSWRRGWACGIRISAANEQAGRQRSRRDDGVCLTTVTGPQGP